MQHPAYKADPWATIRLHAANSLELRPVLGAGSKAAASGKASAADGEISMD
jgi:hypothetical protein